MDGEVRLTGQANDVEPMPRTFTLHSANRALVLVRKIVADLVAEYARVLEFQEIVELEAGYDGAPGLPAELRNEFRDAVDRVRGYIHELDAVGVEVRDFEHGQIDFPARLNGRDICFCWRLAEDTVQFWHEPGGSICSRRPLRDLVAAGLAS